MTLKECLLDIPGDLFGDAIVGTLRLAAYESLTCVAHASMFIAWRE